MHISRQCSINKATLQVLMALKNSDCAPLKELDYIRTIQDEIMHYDDEMNTAQLKCKELKEKLCGRRISG